MGDGEHGEHGEHGAHVGSVGEEAAKLFDALQDWAKEGATNGLGTGLGAALGEQLRSVDEHVASGGQDCLYCPVCQMIAKARQASPEVRTHLAVATSSLLQAAATLLDARAARGPAPRTQVTKIDLDDDDPSR